MGWAGLTGVCYGTPLEAARASCATTVGCQGVTGEPVESVGGSLALSVQTASGASTLHVQPCERLEPEFFGAIMPAVITAAVAILCARVVWRQFQTHT